MLNGSSQGSVCGSWSLLMAAFRVSAAHYLVVYHMDSLEVYGLKKKKVSLPPSLFVCRYFYLCACTILQSVWRRKKPYVLIILLCSFCQLTQTITMYQIKITHFDADLSVFFNFSVLLRGNL